MVNYHHDNSPFKNKINFILFIMQFKDAISKFYTYLDQTAKKYSQKLFNFSTKYLSNPDRFISDIKTQWNTFENTKEIKNIFKDFCKEYTIKVNQIPNYTQYNGISLNKIHNGGLYLNKSYTCEIVKYLVKYQALCSINSYPVEDLYELLVILTINTINRRKGIGEFDPKIQCINKGCFENYFWTSAKIENIINEVTDEIDRGDYTIKDWKGDILMGKEKKLTYFEQKGWVQPRPAVRMTKEWLIEQIGDETSYSEVMNKILEMTGFSKTQVRYRLQKYGLDKKLVKRKYNYKVTEKETKKETSEVTKKETVKETSAILTQKQILEKVHEMDGYPKTEPKNEEEVINPDVDDMYNALTMPGNHIINGGKKYNHKYQQKMLHAQAIVDREGWENNIE